MRSLRCHRGRRAALPAALLAALLGLPCASTATDALPDGNPALRSMVLARLAQGTLDGSTLLGMLGSWLAAPAGAGPEAASPFSALDVLDGEVGNGGFDQYFSNSSGDGWKQALAALALIGDADGAALCAAAGAIFGAQGPAADRARRQDQLTALTRAQKGLLDQQDHRWYDHRDALGARVVAWAQRQQATLRFLAPAAVRYASIDGVATSLKDTRWADPLRHLCLTSPLFRSSGMLAGGDTFDLLVVRRCLTLPRDALAVFAFQAQDPGLGAMLDALAPLAAGIPIRCIVIGDQPALRAYAHADWLLAIPGTASADLERVKSWLGDRLFAPSP